MQYSSRDGRTLSLAKRRSFFAGAVLGGTPGLGCERSGQCTWLIYLITSSYQCTCGATKAAKTAALLGRCPQTRALLAFSRRDVPADLAWRARRRIAE